MKLKTLLLFLLVFAAIGETIYLNLDAKSLFDEPKGLHATEFVNNSIDEQNSEVVVTIKQTTTTQEAESEINQNTSTKATQSKKPCTKNEKLLCQRMKENAGANNYTISNVVNIP